MPARLVPCGTVSRGASPHGTSSRHRRARGDHRTSTASKMHDVSLRVGRSGFGGVDRYVNARVPRARTREPGGRVTLERMTGALCSAKLRNGDPCRRSRPTASSARTTPPSRPSSGQRQSSNGDHTKRRNARQRVPVIAESEPLELEPELAEVPVGGSAGTGAHRSRGGRDDPPRAARGRDQHDPRDLGDLHLPGVRQGLPPGDLRPRPRRADQGDRDAAARGARACWRGAGLRAENARRLSRS